MDRRSGVLIGVVPLAFLTEKKPIMCILLLHNDWLLVLLLSFAMHGCSVTLIRISLIKKKKKYNSSIGGE